MNAATKKTPAQLDRQHARTAGKYKKYNTCELCGKSAGYEYCSIQWLEEAPFYGLGICLHDKCAAKLEAAGKDAAFQMLTAASLK